MNPRFLPLLQGILSALEEDQNALVDLTVEKFSNGEFLENIKEEKGETIARLIPEDEAIKVFENKSTQAEVNALDNDHSKTTYINQTEELYEKSKENENNKGIHLHSQFTHNLLTM